MVRHEVVELMELRSRNRSDFKAVPVAAAWIG